MTARRDPVADERSPRAGVMVDACVHCSCLTPRTVVASDLEREATVGGYVCGRCGASWFTSYLLGTDELTEVLAARRAAVPA